MISNVSNAKADVKLSDGDKIDFGSFNLEVRSTPGHTNGAFIQKESNKFSQKYLKYEIVNYNFG